RPQYEGLPPRKPMVGSFPGCCARAVSGQTAAAPPSSLMNSRRVNRSKCIWTLALPGQQHIGFTRVSQGLAAVRNFDYAEVRSGSKAALLGSPDDVRLAPASSLKADIAGCLKRARTGCEQSQQTLLLDHLVGAGGEGPWYFKAKRFCSLEI